MAYPSHPSVPSVAISFLYVFDFPIFSGIFPKSLREVDKKSTSLIQEILALTLMINVKVEVMKGTYKRTLKVIFVYILPSIAAILVVGEYLLKLKVFDWIGKILNSLWNLNIPSIVFLILILGFSIWLFLLNNKIRSYSKKNIKDILGDNVGVELQGEINSLRTMIKNIQSKSEKEESKTPNIKLGKEERVILNHLANDLDKCKFQENLWDLYHKEFPNDERKHFNFVISDLQAIGFIRCIREDAYEGRIWEITSEGLEVLRDIEANKK